MAALKPDTPMSLKQELHRSYSRAVSDAGPRYWNIIANNLRVCADRGEDEFVISVSIIPKDTLQYLLDRCTKEGLTTKVTDEGEEGEKLTIYGWEEKTELPVEYQAGSLFEAPK